MVLLVSLLILSQYQPFQQKLVNSFLRDLSAQLGTQVKVDRIHWRAFQRLELRSVLLRDLQSDTLLAIDRLTLHFHPLQLFQQKISVDKLYFDRVDLRLEKREDGSFNFDFLTNAFVDTSAAEAVVDTAGSTTPWIASGRQLRFRKLNLTYEDKSTQQTVSAYLETLNAHHHWIDLGQQSVQLASLDIFRPLIEMNVPATVDSLSQEEPDSVLVSLTFPDIGWDIQLGKSQLTEGHFAMRSANSSGPPPAFDPTNLSLQDLRWDIRDLLINEQQIALDIEELAASDHSGLQLEKLTAKLSLSDTVSLLDNFALQTPDSRLASSLRLQYSDWASLLQWASGADRTQASNILARLELIPSQLSPKDLRLLFPSLFKGPNLKKIDLSGKLEGNMARLILQDLNLRYGAKTACRITGNIRDLATPEKLSYNLQLNNARTQYSDLQQFANLPAAMSDWGTWTINGRFQGGMDELAVTKLDWMCSEGPQVKATAWVKNISTVSDLQFGLDVASLQTQLVHWDGFLPDSLLPAFADSLGGCQLKGTLSGGIDEFETDLALQTALGGLESKGSIRFWDDYQNARYQMELRGQQLALNTILQNDSFQTANLDLQIEGEGLQPSDWNNDWTAAVHSLRYRGQTYDSLALTGRMLPSLVKTKALIKDPKLAFALEGDIQLQDSNQIYTLDLQLDTADLQALGLSQRTMVLQTDLRALLSDIRPDELAAEITLADLVLTDSSQSAELKRLEFSSRPPVGTQSRFIELTSDFLDAKMEGTYQLSQLQRVAWEWLDGYFSLEKLQADSMVNQRPLVPTDVRFQLALRDPRAFRQLLLPDLTSFGGLNITGQLNSERSDGQLKAFLPNLVYGKQGLDSLQWDVQTANGSLLSQLYVPKLQLGENTRFLDVSTLLIAEKDSLNWVVQSLAQEDTVAWELAGGLSQDNRDLLLVFQPIVRVNGMDWEIAQKQPIRFATADDWSVNGLQFRQGRQVIYLEADEETSNLQFQDFQIAVFSPLLDLPNGYLEGQLNGSANARYIDARLGYTADLRLDSLTLDSLILGNLSIDARQNGDQLIRFATSLDGFGNQLSAQGDYQLSSGRIQSKAAVQRLEMRALDRFLRGLIHDSKGALTGNFQVAGPLDQVTLQGQLNMKEVETTIDYINARYQIADAQIQIEEDQIDLGRIDMLDNKGRKAMLGGQIRHDYFQDIDLDLRFQTDRFLFLDTKPSDNELFYGKLVLASDVRIKGSPESARYLIDATTLEDTRLVVIPLTDEQAIATDDYILFGRPEIDSLGRDTNYLQRQSLSSPGVDLQLLLTTTDSAELEIIVDPISGDKLTCRGNSRLRVDMDKAGDVSISGAYEITEGSYRFSYDQWIKRSFSILPDSKITFDGDPLTARLGITASYRTKVPLADLVANFISDNDNLGIQRGEVEVRMIIGGDLTHPELEFDIVLVDGQRGPLVELVQARLAQLRSQKTERYKQVFSLLLFNSFLNESTGGVAISEAGETAILSSVSKLISNQLNRLANKVLKGVELELGVDAYRPGIDPSAGEEGLATQVQLGLSKRLFNDRLKVQVGGNLNVGASGSSDSEALTTLTGDFALEYQLSPKGNTMLRVYRRSDYDALNEGNVSRTGAGISIRKNLKNKKRNRNK